MGRKKIIVILGIISMILLAYQVVYAQGVAYTKNGYVVCDQAAFYDMETFWRQGDFNAVDELVKKGRCVWLKPDVQVYFEIKSFPNCAEIHLPGSTEILRTFKEALDMSGTPPKVEIPPASRKSVRKWVELDSLSWVKVGKTTRQEIIKKYPNPRFRDESGGEYAYYGHQHPDFNGWEKISFIFDGNVLAEIRAVKEQK